MNYKLIIPMILLSLTACGPSNSGGGNGGTNNPSSDYASCEALPQVSATAQGSFCPGGVGTWNNYEAKIDASGTVTSFKLWCGGTDEDHPSDQSEYDSYMIPMGNTSSADFKAGSDCVSGSSEDASQNRTVNIWQQVK